MLPMINSTNTISNLPAPRLLLRIVTVRSRSQAQWKPEIKKNARVNGLYNIIYASGWDEFAKLISEPTDLILFNYNMIIETGMSGANIVKMISAMSQYTTGTIPKIATVVDPGITNAQVNKLRWAGCCGVVSNSDYWPVDVGIASINAILETGSSWPEDFISSLPMCPDASLPRVISFWDKSVPAFSAELRQQAANKKLYRVDFCDTWDSFTEALEEPSEIIFFHSKMCGNQNLSAKEIVSMISSLAQYAAGTLPKIGAVVDKDTSIQELIELKKTTVCGIVPNSTYWGVDVGSAAVVAMLNTGSHWPVHRLCNTQQQIDQVMAATTTSKIADIPLTNRQQEIADLIKNRGISNKHIARHLGIGESAVKLHVGAILKKHKLKNRTQLAVAMARGLTA